MENAFTKGKSLVAFIKEKVTAAAWDKMHEAMGTTNKKCTQVLNAPHTADSDFIDRLSLVLDVSPTDLINNFDMGKEKLTLSDIEKLKYKHLSRVKT